MRPANKAVWLCFLFFFFLTVQHVSLLSLFVSCSHTFFWPQKERKGSLSLALSFSIQAAEREAEDILGHMGLCGGALMTEWDAIPSYGAGGPQFWRHRLHTHTQVLELMNSCRWWAWTGMYTCCLYRGFRGTCRGLKHIVTLFSSQTRGPKLDKNKRR